MESMWHSSPKHSGSSKHQWWSLPIEYRKRKKRKKRKNKKKSSNPLDDYEHLLNHVQRHTTCSVDSCLCKKGYVLTCRYNAPWEVRDDSLLFIDEKGRKKYEPTRNDDRLNVHHVDLLAMWCANVDCQPVVSRHVVLKYITKYASKA
jgi:hypothetical protein